MEDMTMCANGGNKAARRRSQLATWRKSCKGCLECSWILGELKEGEARREK